MWCGGGFTAQPPRPRMPARPSPICPPLPSCHAPLEGLSRLDSRQSALFQRERHLIVPPCVGRLGMPLCKSLLGPSISCLLCPQCPFLSVFLWGWHVGPELLR